jgi:hypothetical protein
MSQRKKKTRTQLISSLPPSTRNTVPARWSDTGSKVACREISIIVLHASCGGQDLCLRFKGPYSKTTSLQLPLLHGTSSTHESRGCRRLYRFVCIHTTFRRLFHLTACACCWSDHFVGWSRFKLLLGLLPVIALSTCSSNHIDLQSHRILFLETKKKKTENKRSVPETQEQ